MDPLTFAKNLANQEKAEPRLARWAERYLEQTASQTLHAARFVDEAGDTETKEQYLAALEYVLTTIPDDMELEVSKDLLETLIRISNAKVKALLEKRLTTAPGLTAAL